MVVEGDEVVEGGGAAEREVRADLFRNLDLLEVESFIRGEFHYVVGLIKTMFK